MEESFYTVANSNGRRTEVAGQNDPVFVLCMGRSGSTLLRFILDAHPDLACPPETNLPALCAQLAIVWSLIEGAPLSATRGDTPPVVPEPAIVGIRHTMDTMTASYLVRRGKKRFCDKSLGSAQFADLLVRIYPTAKFVCLYRHPMDVIRSALDACPWGLNGYGLEPYINGSPGNAVLALARYWLDHAASIAEVEDQYPTRCHQIRYEDLVAAPEEVTQKIFAFLGVTQIPGITERCFTGDRERFGPADHKIWATSKISSDSIGDGQTVPAGLIPPPITNAINCLADRLGYVLIDDNWGTTRGISDPRVLSEIQPPVPPQGQAPRGRQEEEDTRLLTGRIREGFTRIDDGFGRRWAPYAEERCLIVSGPHSSAGTGWIITPASRAMSACPVEAEYEWQILGPPAAWRAVLLGHTNLYDALRRYQLRYCDSDAADPLVAQTRIAMLADLLGIGPRRDLATTGPAKAESTSLVVPS
jgi:hypothetical protein